LKPNTGDNITALKPLTKGVITDIILEKREIVHSKGNSGAVYFSANITLPPARAYLSSEFLKQSNQAISYSLVKLNATLQFNKINMLEIKFWTSSRSWLFHYQNAMNSFRIISQLKKVFYKKFSYEIRKK